MYELIQHQEVGAGGASSITFSGIPQIYTDLYLVVSARDGRSYPDDDFRITINNNTAVAYSNRRLSGNGSGVLSDGGSDTSHTYSYIGRLAAATATANTFGNASMYFSNYTSSNAKSISSEGVSENNGTSTGMGITANLVNDTNPITSIKLEGYNNGTLLQYTTATLFGVGRKAGIGRQPLASGGYTSFVDGYWVHTFTANGSFKPFVDLDVEYLVIAGGAGGARQGGGGGGGGYRSSVSGESSGGGASAESALSLTASTLYPVTVGAGGSGGTGSYPTNGSNSVFSSITATGGGRGGIANTGDVSGASGGSGGGGWGDSGAGGAGTSNQGFDGGNGASVGAGGGGGAGGTGYAAFGGNGGDGGSGVPSSITGSIVARAGGGGGGCQSIYTAGDATDGGGSGSNSNTATADSGTVNTGGGGGGTGFVAGQSNTSTGGAGGSGIVIVRYRA